MPEFPGRLGVLRNSRRPIYPTVSVGLTEEYSWKLVPVVTEKILGMGETLEDVYISEELLTNILFDQTYEAELGLKSTVIQGEEKSENKLPIILAEGVFSKNTTISLEEQTNMTAFVENWKVLISKEGVTRLHYLMPADVNTSFVKLYVRNEEGKWQERAYTIDGSYIVFDFTDEDTNFAFLEDYSNLSMLVTWIGIGVAALVVLIGVLKVARKNKRKVIES